MKIETSTPYVISADIRQPLARWGFEEKYTTPSNGLLDSLLFEMQQEMSPWFPHGVEIVNEHETRKWMGQKVKESRIPVISLDRTYINPNSYPNIIGAIDATRVVDQNFEDLGLMARPNTPSLEDQMSELVSKSRRHGIRNVALLDDVIFSGRTHARLIEELREYGLDVTQMYAGISIGEGQRIVEDAGVRVEHHHVYKDVYDEVCERDFYAGAPNSGRVVVYQSEKGVITDWTSAPYFAPFGNAEKWASIPSDKVGQYSDMCLQQSIFLWSRIERASNKTLPIGRLPRKLQIQGYAEDVSIVTALKDIKKQLVTL